MVPLCASFSKWSCRCLKGKLELPSLCFPLRSAGLLDSTPSLSGQSHSCSNSLALLALSQGKRKRSRLISLLSAGPVFCTLEVSLSAGDCLQVICLALQTRAGSKLRCQQFDTPVTEGMECLMPLSVGSVGKHSLTGFLNFSQASGSLQLSSFRAVC